MSSKKPGYSFVDCDDGRFKFCGPQMPAYDNDIYCDKRDAESIARMLARAFNAGVRHQQEETKRILGINDIS